MYERASYKTEGPFVKKTLIRSGSPKTRKVVLLAGEVRAAGAVLGKITASGKYKLSAAAAGDGSETPDLVLAHDADATGADREVIVYENADLIGSQLVLGAGHTLASIREGMRDKGITFSV